jgi:hypothetical protein
MRVPLRLRQPPAGRIIVVSRFGAIAVRFLAGNGAGAKVARVGAVSSAPLRRRQRDDCGAKKSRRNPILL